MKEELDIHRVEIKGVGSPGWQRSIKRICIARKWRWLFTAPKPFHQVLLQELGDTFALSAEPLPVITHPAGALVEGKPGEIYSLLMGIRSASKGYMIIDTFRAGATEELFRRISLLPWELLLPGRGACRVKAHLERCRIGHEGAAAETVLEAIEKRLSEAKAPAAKALSSIILFGEENRMELRLDIAGEHLHRRGYRKYVSNAPLRETVAASLLLWYLGLRGPFSQLYDPMCGSATFPIEGWAMAAKVPLGAWRPYHLKELPFFSRKSWDWEVKRGLEKAKELSPGFWGCASDNDAKIVEAAKGNIAELAQKVPFPVKINLSQADFFTLEPGIEVNMAETAGRALLVLNPPYGKRLYGGGHPAALFTLYQSIIRRWDTHWQGWDLLLIIPKGIEGSIFGRVKPVEGISFDNGGIPVTAYLFAAPISHFQGRVKQPLPEQN